MKHRFVVVLTAVFAVYPMIAFAQALPVTPDPSECVVAPRPVSFFAPLVSELLAATPTARPVVTPVEVEAGEPADEATEAEVVALLRQMIACTNAGDFPRLAALFTEDGAREAVVGGWGVSIQAARDASIASGRTPLSDQDILDLITTSGPPVPEESRSTLVDVRDVRELRNGHVVATIVRTLSDGSEIEAFTVFMRDEGQLGAIGETVLTHQGTPVP